MFPPFHYTTMDLEKKIIYMQALFRGHRVRQSLMKTEDKMSLDIVKKLVDHYNDTLRFHALINTELSKKKYETKISLPTTVKISQNLLLQRNMALCPRGIRRRVILS